MLFSVCFCRIFCALLHQGKELLILCAGKLAYFTHGGPTRRAGGGRGGGRLRKRSRGWQTPYFCSLEDLLFFAPKTGFLHRVEVLRWWKILSRLSSPSSFPFEASTFPSLHPPEVRNGERKTCGVLLFSSSFSSPQLFFFFFLLLGLCEYLHFFH